MARPTTKEDLLQASQSNFEKLFDLITSLTREEQEMTFAFDDRDRNIRDVLTHLYEWHQLLLNWVKRNTAGESVTFLPAPYNWRTYPQMNLEFWKKHQTTALDQATEMLLKSHAQVMALIETFNNEALFRKDAFAWTGSTTLGSYCVSATSSHYDWAIKNIRKHKKTAGSAEP